ncbi:uncharacterized protein BJ171DRAFT_177851 [Polychytrium aggregatum]|uniref:uncharacterized protein n=1 Tax=Polychytrium aggregatum TaxID=110093 RepID=UPI0022FE7400|nr:uncharacterized protein BJ171DRAFT_177851 [Polychytrium aggregatum]KAI9202590.1 hypothetical protein BJ171DRAFT_177851 [Polychytrium aggregatum]
MSAPEEVQPPHARRHPDLHVHIPTPRIPPSEMLTHAARASLRAMCLGFGIRSGFLLLVKLIAVLRRKTSIRSAIRRSLFHEETLRFAAFFGSFAFIWKLVNNIMVHLRQKEDKWNGFVAGSLAGLSILAEESGRRRAIAQQLAVRACQCIYNGLKSRGIFHFHMGDTLIFALSTAQIMYSYVVQPHTIPKVYYNFIVSISPIPDDILKLVRRNVKEIPIPSIDFIQAARAHHGTARALSVASELSSLPSIIPCDIVHPSTSSCTQHGLRTFFRVVIRILPVHLGLNVVPMILLKHKDFIKTPLAVVQKAISNSAVSTTFLATFTWLYMTLACGTRRLADFGLMKQDHRYNYWLIGLLASSAILIEDKRRRSELAMYVVPRGLVALYTVMYERKWMIRIPHFDLGMFSVAMGVLIAFYQTEPTAMSSLIYKILKSIDSILEDGIFFSNSASKALPAEPSPESADVYTDSVDVISVEVLAPVIGGLESRDDENDSAAEVESDTPSAEESLKIASFSEDEDATTAREGAARP